MIRGYIAECITECIKENITEGPLFLSSLLYSYVAVSPLISLSVSPLSALFISLSIQLNPGSIGLPKRVYLRSVSI